MEWWDYDADIEVEGGALEFDFRLELHIYQPRGGGGTVAVWLNDDATFSRTVKVAEA